MSKPNPQDVTTKPPPAVATVISTASTMQMASATPYYQRPMATATATAAGKPPGDGYEEVREQVRPRGFIRLLESRELDAPCCCVGG